MSVLGFLKEQDKGIVNKRSFTIQDDDAFYGTGIVLDKKT